MSDAEKPTLKDIYKEILANRSEITASNEALVKLVETTQGCLTSLQETTARLSSLENEVKAHSRQLDYLSRNERRNNLVIFNIPEVNERNRADLAQKIINIFQDSETKVHMHSIVDCFRVGKRSGKRPVVLKLTSFILKQAILDNKQHLINQGYEVKPDYPPEERKLYSEIKPFILELRKYGKKPFIKNGKVVVDGTAYSVEELRRSIELPSQQTEIPPGSKRKPEDILTPTRSKLLKFAFHKTSSGQATPALPPTGAGSLSNQPSGSQVAAEADGIPSRTSALDGYQHLGIDTIQMKNGGAGESL